MENNKGCAYCQSQENLNTSFNKCEHKACDACVINIIFHNYLEYVPSEEKIEHNCPLCSESVFKYPPADVPKLLQSLSQNELRFDFFCVKHNNPTYTYCQNCQTFVCVGCNSSHPEGEQHKLSKSFYEKYKADPNLQSNRSLGSSHNEGKVKLPLKYKTFASYQEHLKKAINNFQKKLEESTKTIISRVDLMIGILNGYKKQLMEEMNEHIEIEKKMINIYKQFYSKFYSDISQAFTLQSLKPLENLMSTINRQFSTVDVSGVSPILEDLDNLKEEIDGYISTMKKMNLRFIFPIIARVYTNKNTLAGHSDIINCVTLLRGGDIASGGRDNVVRIWKKDKNYENTLVLEGHTGWVSSMLLLGDGKLVSGAYDGTLKVWDNKKNYELINTYQGHTNGVSALIQFGKGNIVSSSFDNIIIVRYKTFKIKETLKEHTFGVFCLAKLPNGFFASGSGDKTIKIWDSECQVEKTLRGHNSTVSSLCTMKNKQLLASGSTDRTIKIWDYIIGECVFTVNAHNDGVGCVICLYDGRLVSCGGDHLIKIWDNENNYNCTHILKGHSSVINCLLILDDENILSASADKIMKIWKEEKSVIQQLQ